MAWYVELYDPGAKRPKFHESFDTFDEIIVCVDQLARQHVGEEYIMRFVTPGSATPEQNDTLAQLGILNEPLPALD